jgi:Ala-tRNA(Pro) deacylase
MSIYSTICEKLTVAGIAYTTEHHAPVTTSEAAAVERGVSMHEGAKALALEGQKSGKCWLFVMPGDLRLDTKKVAAIVGERVSFARDPEKATGCVKGSVPPMGSVLGLETYCDNRLAENEMIHFNAGSLTDSITMRYDDYIRIENPKMVDVTIL